MGKGGFAKVYFALEQDGDCSTSRIAIKVVPRKRIEREDQLNRIEHEIKLHKKLDHPNIVKMYSSFADDQKVCFRHFVSHKL